LELDRRKIHTYSVQILSSYDAFINKVLTRYFTKEYRRAQGRNEGEAVRNAGAIGPYEAIGTVRRVL